VYNIRSATIHDIDAIHALVRESVFKLCKDHYSISELEAYLSSFPKIEHYNKLLSDRIIIVAIENDTIVGYTQYDPSSSTVDAIYVLPNHTCKGAGSHLLRYVEDIARSLKKDEILISASINAVSFYEKSNYIFQEKFFKTCSDGTKFKSVKYRKNINL